MEPRGNAINTTPAGKEIPGQGGPPTPHSPLVQAGAVNARRQLRYTHAGGERPLDGYTIKRGIGIGGFGEVYFAISDAGKEVALKRIQRNLDIELRGVRQCLNLKHVNLIALWDIRTSGEGDSWVVMEYVPGHSLRDLLQQHSRGLLEADVRHWFLSICAGVCYLHDRGIVHRDLKPGNIFYDNDEKIVKIGDYGLSKFISHSRGSGHTESVGTFHYMAPEIGRGVYGKGIDIYALGVILFELLTGELPFDGESSHEIIMKHLTASPPMERIPPSFRTAVETALAKDPETRYANVREMLLDLPWDEARAAASMTASPASQIPPPPGCDQPTHHFPDVEVVSVSGSYSDDGGIFYIGEETVTAAAGDGNRLSGQFDLRKKGLPFAPATGSASAARPASPRHISNEPLARAMTVGTVGLWQWFQNAPLATPLKVVLAAGVGLVLLINSAWLFPVAIGLGLLYLIYFAIRSWTVGDEFSAPPAERSRPESQATGEGLLRQQLAARPLSDRLIELTASLLIAAVSAIVVGLLVLTAGGGWTAPPAETWARYVWLACTATFASWAVLATGKVWECSRGDVWQRRMVMAGIGLLAGLASFGIRGYLSLDAPVPGESHAIAGTSPQFPAELPATLVLFTCLFGLLRWWRMADPLRSTRLSLWSTGLCVVLAVVLSASFNLEPTGSAMLSLMMATAVQIAAPWIPPAERETCPAPGLSAGSRPHMA